MSDEKYILADSFTGGFIHGHLLPSSTAVSF